MNKDFERYSREMSIPLIRSQFSEAKILINDFIEDQNNLDLIYQAAKLIVESFDNYGKVISCGNGGSHCDAMHFAEELSGKFRIHRSPLPAIAISDPSHITCVGNDYGFNHIFSRYIEALGNESDVLFCLTTSGNSQNVIEAIQAAKSKGMKVVALTGDNGGKVAEIGVDVEIRIPHIGYSDRIQEMHIKIIHTIILLIETLIDQSRLIS